GTSSMVSGYGGMGWLNFSVVDPTGSIFVPSGLVNGTISGTSVAFNDSGNPASFKSVGEDFQLKKMWLTVVWSNDLTVTVDGYDNGVLVATKSFVVDYDAPKKAKFGNK